MSTKKTSKKTTAPTKKTTRTSVAKKKTATKKAPIKKASKQTSKKASVKKTGTKTKRAKKPALSQASDEQSFWVTNGLILNDLLALSGALDVMEKDVYAHHVDTSKNDFADWVAAVLGDEACASALRTCKTPKSAKMVVVKHIKLYSA